MTILGRLLKRTGSYQSWFLNDAGEGEPFGGGVSAKSAAGLVAFMSAVRLLTDDVATLPIGAFFKRNGQVFPLFPRPAWLDSPIPADPNTTRVVWVSDMMSSALFDGNIMLNALPNVYQAEEISVIDPSRVDPRRIPATKEPYYVIDGRTKLGPDTIIHVPFVKLPGQERGVSFLESARRTIGAGISVEKFAANFFDKGISPSVAIEMPPGVKLTPDQAKEYADRFAQRHQGAGKAHGVAVIDQGATIKPWSLTPEQAQFIQTRLATKEDIATLFRIPPHMLQIVTPGAASYASVEQQSIDYVVHTIRPYIERIEQALTRLLPPLPDGTQPYVKFNVAGLLRGDLKSRYDAYGVGIQWGFVTVDDVRKLEDMAPLDGGGTRMIPLTHGDPTMIELKTRMDIAANAIRAGFEPEAATKLAGLPPMKHNGLPPVTSQPIYLIDPSTGGK